MLNFWWSVVAADVVVVDFDVDDGVVADVDAVDDDGIVVVVTAFGFRLSASSWVMGANAQVTVGHASPVGVSASPPYWKSHEKRSISVSHVFLR